MQNDNRIVTTGYGSGQLSRLNTDGTIDSYFFPQTDSGTVIFTSCIQADGKIIIGGFFNSYGGVIRKNLSLIHI